MNSRSRPTAPFCRAHAFTLVEVSVATLLVCIGLASIVAIHSRTVELLRATQQAAVASLILQQRVESLRKRQWVEISSAPALARLMAHATDSEKELAAVRFTEVLTVSRVQPSAAGPSSSLPVYEVRRVDGAVRITQDGDVSDEPSLLVTTALTWSDAKNTRARTMRSLICRDGLTRSGILGSGLGRPPSTSP